MSEPTVELNPSEQLIQAAKATVSITDNKGRAILLRKPRPLALIRFVEMIGGHAASNEVYMGMVMPLIYVETVDGNPVSVSTKMQFEALVQELDEDGIVAVQKGVQGNFGTPDPEAEKVALKN